MNKLIFLYSIATYQQLITIELYHNKQLEKMTNKVDYQ